MERFDLFPKAYPTKLRRIIDLEYSSQFSEARRKKAEAEEKYSQLKDGAMSKSTLSQMEHFADRYTGVIQFLIDLIKCIIPENYRSKEHSDNNKVRDFAGYIGFMSIYKYVLIGIILGAIGLIAGTASMIATGEYDDFAMFVFGGLGGGLGVGFIGRLVAAPVYVLISPVFYPIYLLIRYFAGKSLQKKLGNIENQYNTEITTINGDIARLERAKTADFDRKVRQYKIDFEKAVDSKKVLYCDSPVVGDVAEWIKDKLLMLIKMADRSKGVPRIDVVFKYTVYKEKISISTGEEYVFARNRCENLTSAVMQSAIAKIIAANVKLKLATAYEKDESGTGYGIRDEFEQSETAETVTLTYSAPNGWYERIRGW